MGNRYCYLTESAFFVPPLSHTQLASDQDTVSWIGLEQEDMREPTRKGAASLQVAVLFSEGRRQSFLKILIPNVVQLAARRSGAASRYNQAAGICDDNCDLHDSAAALPSIWDNYSAEGYVVPHVKSSIDMDARRREIRLGTIPVGYEYGDGMFSFLMRNMQGYLTKKWV